MASLESRIKALELDVGYLRRLLEPVPKGKRPIRLKGALKGVRFSAEDVREAKRSLFQGKQAKQSI